MQSPLIKLIEKILCRLVPYDLGNDVVRVVEAVGGNVKEYVKGEKVACLACVLHTGSELSLNIGIAHLSLSYVLPILAYLEEAKKVTKVECTVTFAEHMSRE